MGFTVIDGRRKKIAGGWVREVLAGPEMGVMQAPHHLWCSAELVVGSCLLDKGAWQLVAVWDSPVWSLLWGRSPSDQKFHRAH